MKTLLHIYLIEINEYEIKILGSNYYRQLDHGNNNNVPENK